MALAPAASSQADRANNAAFDSATPVGYAGRMTSKCGSLDLFGVHVNRPSRDRHSIPEGEAEGDMCDINTPCLCWREAMDEAQISGKPVDPPKACRHIEYRDRQRNVRIG